MTYESFKKKANLLRKNFQLKFFNKTFSVYQKALILNFKLQNNLRELYNTAPTNSKFYSTVKKRL